MYAILTATKKNRAVSCYSSDWDIDTSDGTLQKNIEQFYSDAAEFGDFRATPFDQFRADNSVFTIQFKASNVQDQEQCQKGLEEIVSTCTEHEMYFEGGQIGNSNESLMIDRVAE